MWIDTTLVVWILIITSIVSIVVGYYITDKDKKKRERIK